MSTVLWANVLMADGKVVSEQADYPALYRHAEKLQKLSKEAGLPGFEEHCDLTDIRYNMEDLPLPDGMTSTDELMARDGVWLEPAKMVALLQSLEQKITQGNVRFGLLSNQQSDVLEELRLARAYFEQQLGAAQPAASLKGFNFSVIM